MSEAAAANYVMGHDDRERRRLALQASILNPFTEQFLRRAGLAAGMRVLDIGCGIGEVSMIAARLVGRQGQVTGIDIDESALVTARQRAGEQGFGNIVFCRSDVRDYRPELAIDALIGRHILIHTPDPLALLRGAYPMLSPGGVAAFQEFDFTLVQPSYPESPLRDRICGIFRDCFRQIVHRNMGMQLYHLMCEAGFSSPDCRAEYPIDGGPDSPFYEWLAESLRSILPRVEALELARADEIGIDTLADRLRDEAVSRKSAGAAPLMVGCFARKR